MTAPSLEFLAALLFGLMVFGCENEAPSSAKAADAANASPAKSASESSKRSSPPDRKVSGEHPVTCGCTLEEVGHCGEYAQVGGHFVELQLPASSELGKMPFCGREGLTALIEGELTGGRLVASSFELKAP